MKMSKKFKLKRKIMDKKANKIFKRHFETDVMREIEMAETKPYPFETPDFYGEIGCCAVCDENNYKEVVKGLQFNIYFGDKHFDCMCLDCKCRKCTWYDPYSKECSRKYVADF